MPDQPVTDNPTPATPSDLAPGDVVWVALSPAQGREQSGHRPAVVVSGAGYLDAVTTLAIVLPATTVDRGWPNHVRLSGRALHLAGPTWAMTEQPRTMYRGPITDRARRIDADCLAQVRRWLTDVLDL